MKPPSSASLKKVNAEILANLGAERLAVLLTEVAEMRPDPVGRLTQVALTRLNVRSESRAPG